jgi:putative DNA primase/helicase
MSACRSASPEKSRRVFGTVESKTGGSGVSLQAIVEQAAGIDRNGHPLDVSADHFKNDIGYADAFVRRHAGSIRYCADEKLWLAFDEENGWQRDEIGRIKAMAADYARELYRWGVRKAMDMDPESGKRIVATMAALGNRKRIEPALSFAACNPAIVVRSEQLDADPFIVGVENGVVDLRDGTFQPHSRERLVTRRLAVRFDADATAPTWERFLIEVQPDAEARAFLQRLAGYSLTGEIREHVLPFHFGVGANGKGTFLEHSLLKLAGSYGAKLTDSLVYASDRGHLPHLELANLCGRRFALGEENAESGKLNEALLKSITGGDRQKGRFHYGNFVEYSPTYKIALVGNHKPRIDGTDDGIWRRFLLVDWPVQIPLERRDALLKDKLAAELPGIFNWAAGGTRAWLAEGLNPPESCRVATAEFREKSDSLAEFIAENFHDDPEGSCTKSAVFAAYRQWADKQGIGRPMSKRGLGFQLVNRGWQEFRSGHGKSHCWSGRRLKTPLEL